MTKKTLPPVLVNHAAVAWALASTLAVWPEGVAARAIMDAASRLGAAMADADLYDLRSETMLLELLDSHLLETYDLDGQDRRKGRRAYDALVRLAGGPDGAPEPEDRASAEWRHWMMRRVRADFESGDRARYVAAWDRYSKLFWALAMDRNFFHVSFALRLLPQLLAAKQEIAELL